MEKRDLAASAARTGIWGEDTAARHLERRGWSIVGRRVRPCRNDRRCEIDIVAREPDGSIVFVEVKTHARRSPLASRLWCIDRRKKSNLLRACVNWIMREKWRGRYRFDVIEVYGSCAGPCLPEVDHIENVPLFPRKWRFW